MVTHMVGVGEETGALDSMLDKVAEFYEDQVEASVKALTSILEPIMIIVIGGIVGFIVISMYLPLFEVYNQHQIIAVTLIRQDQGVGRDAASRRSVRTATARPSSSSSSSVADELAAPAAQRAHVRLSSPSRLAATIACRSARAASSS